MKKRLSAEANYVGYSRRDVRCGVDGCNSKSKDFINVSFHSYPTGDRAKIKVRVITEEGDEVVMTVLEAWHYHVGRKEVNCYSGRRVCSRHFLPEDFIKTGKNTGLVSRLKTYATPTQNLPDFDRSTEINPRANKKLVSEKNKVTQRQPASSEVATTSNSGTTQMVLTNAQDLNPETPSNNCAVQIRNRIKENMVLNPVVKNIPLVPRAFSGTYCRKTKVPQASVSDTRVKVSVIPTETRVLDKEPSTFSGTSCQKPKVSQVSASDTRVKVTVIPTETRVLDKEPRAFSGTSCQKIKVSQTSASDTRVKVPVIPTETRVLDKETVKLLPIPKESFLAAAAGNANNIKVIPSNVQIPASMIFNQAPTMLQPILMSTAVGNSNNILILPPNLPIQMPNQIIGYQEGTSMLQPISKETFVTASHSSSNRYILPKCTPSIQEESPSPVQQVKEKEHESEHIIINVPINETCTDLGTFHTPKEGSVNYRQKCIVPGCENTCKRNRNRSFHNFPSSSRATLKVLVKTVNGEVVMDCLQAWLYKTQTSEIMKGENYSSYEVCSKHFSPDDYIRTYGGVSRRLKASAVPTLNLPPEILSYNNPDISSNDDSSGKEKMDHTSANVDSDSTQPGVIDFASVTIKTEIEDETYEPPSDPLSCVSVEYNKHEETEVNPFETVYLIPDNVIKQELFEEIESNVDQEYTNEMESSEDSGEHMVNAPQNEITTKKYRDNTHIFRCYNCNLTFLTKEQYKNHDIEICNKHLINLQCLYCDEILNNTKELNEHFYNDHFACKCCDIFFKNTDELAKHITEHNKGSIFFYTCLICALEFKCFESFTNHTTSVHKNKIARCSSFKKNFDTDSSQLSRHCGKPYKIPSCPYCNIFVSPIDLPKHLEKFHNIANCILCKINYKRIIKNSKYCRPCAMNKICTNVKPSSSRQSFQEIQENYLPLECVLNESNSVLDTSNMNQFKSYSKPVLPETSTTLNNSITGIENNDDQYKPVEKIKIEILSDSETPETNIKVLDSSLLYPEVVLANETNEKPHNVYKSDVNIGVKKQNMIKINKKKNVKQVSLLIKRNTEKNTEEENDTLVNILKENKTSDSGNDYKATTSKSNQQITKKDNIYTDSDSDIAEESIDNNIADDEDSNLLGAIYTISVRKNCISKASTSQKDKTIVTFPNPEQHVCNHCNDIFSLADYETHTQNNYEMINADDYKNLPCLYCLELCRNANTLDSHIQVVHKICKVCNLSFATLTLLKKHEKEHSKGKILQHFMCQCGVEFKTIEEHNIHVNEYSQSETYSKHNALPIKCTNISFQNLNTDKMIKAQCAYCNTFVFKQLCVLRKHLRNFHSIFYCKICFKHFVGKRCDIFGVLDICYTCNRGENSEIGPEKTLLKRSNSDDSNIVSNKKIKLSNIQANVDIIKPLEYKNDNDTEDDIEESSDDNDDLNSPNIQIEASNDKTNISEYEIPIKQTNVHQTYCKSSSNKIDNYNNCQICNNEFKNSLDYNLHMQIHKRINKYDSNGKCSLCNEIFYNYCSFCIHFYDCHSQVKIPDPYLELNKKGYKCPICHAYFTDKNTFFTHCVPYTLIQKLSTDCYICKIRFGSFRTLEYHYAVKHKKEQIFFMCKICKTAKFPEEELLHTHVIDNHNKKMVHCRFCKKDFNDTDYFNSHIEACNQNDLKECLFCNVKDHTSLDHENDLDFEYLCDFCLNHFSSADNLKQHIENIHGKICVVIDT